MPERQVKVNLSGLNALQKDMPKLTDKLEKMIADRTPSEIVKNIRRRLQGINPRFKLPPIVTPNRKGHDQPLVDDGILTTTSMWSISKKGSGYVVAPPEQRETASYHLHNGLSNGKKFKFMEIKKGFFPNWAKVMTVAFFDKVIPKYT